MEHAWLHVLADLVADKVADRIAEKVSPQPLLLDSHAVAKLLGISHTAAIKRITRRQLPVVVVEGGSVYVDRRRLEAQIAEGRVSGA